MATSRHALTPDQVSGNRWTTDGRLVAADSLRVELYKDVRSVGGV